MDVGAWIAWGVTTLIALGGLALGIRAELRAVRYPAEWALDVQKNRSLVTLYNRTGEDAANVRVLIRGGSADRGTTPLLVAADETIELQVAPDRGQPDEFTVEIEVTWDRRKTGKAYTWTPGAAVPLAKPSLQRAIIWR